MKRAVGWDAVSGFALMGRTGPPKTESVNHRFIHVNSKTGRENTTISGGYSMFDNIIEGYVSYKSQNTLRLRGCKRTYTGEQLN